MIRRCLRSDFGSKLADVVMEIDAFFDRDEEFDKAFDVFIKQLGEDPRIVFGSAFDVRLCIILTLFFMIIQFVFRINVIIELK